MNKGLFLYLSIAILLLLTIYLLFDEPEKIVIQKSKKIFLESKQDLQSDNIKIEYTTTDKPSLTTKSLNTIVKRDYVDNNYSNLNIENKEELLLTKKQQEFKKEYELNQQIYTSKMEFNHINEKEKKYQDFLKMRSEHIARANRNPQNLPEIKEKLAYENAQNINKMHIMMLNKDR